MGCNNSRVKLRSNHPSLTGKLTGLRKRGQVPKSYIPSNISESEFDSFCEKFQSGKTLGYSSYQTPENLTSRESTSSLGSYLSVIGHSMLETIPSTPAYFDFTSPCQRLSSVSSTAGPQYTTRRKGRSLGRKEKGYRRKGQHARSSSQVRREQKKIEAQKPYVYTGPKLAGKRKPGQIPASARIDKRRHSSFSVTLAILDARCNAKNCKGRQGWALANPGSAGRSPWYEKAGSGSEENKDDEFYMINNNALGLRRRGDTAALKEGLKDKEEEIVISAENYQGIKGKRRRQLTEKTRDKKARRKVSNEKDDVQPIKDIGNFFGFGDAFGYD